MEVHLIQTNSKVWIFFLTKICITNTHLGNTKEPKKKIILWKEERLLYIVGIIGRLWWLSMISSAFKTDENEKCSRFLGKPLFYSMNR